MSRLNVEPLQDQLAFGVQVTQPQLRRHSAQIRHGYSLDDPALQPRRLPAPPVSQDTADPFIEKEQAGDGADVVIKGSFCCNAADDRNDCRPRSHPGEEDRDGQKHKVADVRVPPEEGRRQAGPYTRSR